MIPFVDRLHHEMKVKFLFIRFIYLRIESDIKNDGVTEI